MFAAVQTKNYMSYMLYGFFVSVYFGLYLNDIRLFKSRAYPYSDMSMVLGRTWEANSLSCIYTFHNSYAMTKNDEFCNAENNSICITTDAHETCTLTGDPFKDIAQFGFDLHGCKISFRKKPNKHGHTVTGWFNISGRMESGAGNSYEDIIMYIVERSRAYQVYVSLCHKARKERYWANRVKREAASINV